MIYTAEDPELPKLLARRLSALACTPHLLVACDFDGTLAPIVEDPEVARALPEAAQALNALADLPGTSIALVSGRSLGNLSRVAAVIDRAIMVGSHGAEFATHEVEVRRMRIRESLSSIGERLARSDATFRLEDKPFGVAVHFRAADERTWEACRLHIEAAFAGLDAVTIRSGKAVVEASVLDVTKGFAIDELRRICGATGVFFAGDDVTDEDAFRALGRADVGVKVGDGPTIARFAVASPAALVSVLSHLHDERRKFSSF